MTSVLTMADPALHDIASYCLRSQNLEVPASAGRALCRHLIDSIGCALGAYDATTVDVARRIAATAQCSASASVIASGIRSTPEFATFANAAMIRYLDFNDTGIGGHPSDMIAAILAVCESEHIDGAHFVRALFVAYEVYAELRRGGMMLRTKHVDQLQATIGAAAGLCVALRLDFDQTCNTISMALTPCIPLRVTRTGQLSDWKACATAHGTMNAVFAARLARAGLRGPDAPFAGVAGLYDLLNIAPLDLRRLGESRDGRTAIECTGLKKYPAEYSAQGPIALALQLRNDMALENIDHIEIALHWGGWHEIGGGQGDRKEKWNPTTRESADHSLPFIVACALRDGELTRESFAETRFTNPDLTRLMQRVDVVEDPTLTSQHAGDIPTWPSRIGVRQRDGGRYTKSVASPRGHPFNPLSDAELVAKFRELSAHINARYVLDELLDTLWNIGALDDVARLGELLCGVKNR